MKKLLVVLKYLCFIVFIILLILVIIESVSYEKECNDIINRTVYYYGNDNIFEDSEGLKRVIKKRPGFISNMDDKSYYLVDYNLVDDNPLYGRMPKNAEEVAVSPLYCSTWVKEDNKSFLKNECNEDVLGNKLIFNDFELTIVGITENNYFTPGFSDMLNLDVDSEVLVDTSLVSKYNTDDLYIYKATFDNYKQAQNINGDTFVYSTLYINDYLNYLKIFLVIFSIINILIIVRRIYEIRKCK